MTRIVLFRGCLALAASLLFVGANPPVTINVDAAVNRHPISETIYGASFASPQAVMDLGLTTNRWGGNAVSRHNWAISTTNRAKDYFFENIPDPVSSGDGSNGKSADDFIGPTIAAGAQPIMTIPMMGMLPFDRTIRCGYSVMKYGSQDDTDPFRPDCGNGKKAGERLRFVNDPADTSAIFPSSHQGSWIQHMITTFGSAANGGVRFFSLDNEPGLWSFDHWDVHPNGTSYDEARSKMFEYGALIRATEPNALITGPEEWGWDGYFYSGLDLENFGTPAFGADRAAHGDVPFVQYMLQQAKAYHDANGVRILDYFTLHFYPQSGEFSSDVSEEMQLLRNRSTRSLWDPAYVDESYIGDTGINGGIVRLIPLLKQWTASDYPGTKTGITEYNWGADNHINGGTAQADVLGIFGREALDLGVRWVTPSEGSFTYNAFKMYRNYDGAQSKFGDMSVSAAGPNVDQVAPFAAVRSIDNALTIMIVTKHLADTTAATVNIANFTPLAGAMVQRWQLDSGNAITRLADLPAGSPLSLVLPPQSVTLLIVAGSNASQGAGPANFAATATSTSSISLTWSPVADAISYEIQRKSGGSAFSALTAVGGTSHADNNLAANTSYVYKVRAVKAAGVTDFSAVDASTTIAYADEPLASGTAVKAVHFTQLRTGVNAMRVAAGLPQMIFTDPALAAGTLVRAAHINELRTALDEARAAIGLPALVHDASTTIKATHVSTVRAGTY